MKKMRTKWVLAGVALVLVLGLAGCGGSDGGSSDSENAAVSGSTGSENAAVSVSDGYTVTLSGAVIVMNADAAPILETLGEESSYFESESCAFEGLDKVYTYPGFKLNTYPIDDTDYVSSVVFMDDTVETDEGICIGSSEEDVILAYGEADEETDAALIYEKGDSRMTIGISGGAVTTIEIAAITE